MIFKSVKFRITLWYALILAVILFGFTFFIYSQFAKTLNNQVDKSLSEEVEGIKRSLTRYLEVKLTQAEMAELSRLTLNEPKYSPVLSERLNELLSHWEVQTGNIRRETIMLRLIGFDRREYLTNLKGWQQDIIFPNYERDSTFMEEGTSFQTIHFEKMPIRIHYDLLRFQTRPILLIQSARPINELQTFLQHLTFIIVVAIPGAVLAACFGGVLVARRSFKPVDSMIRDAEKITAAYLADRLPRTGTGDELDRLAATLNDMMDRIELSTKTVQEFSSNVSHELKTPLAIIRGEIDLALRRPRSNEEYQKTLVTIEEEVNELIQLVDDLLLLVKSDARQLKLDLKSIPLLPVLEQIVERFKERAESKGINLRLVSSKNSAIKGDALHLKRLFSNLIDNAIKFTQKGGNVVVELTEEIGDVTIKIADDGIGIEPEKQTKVFARFYRTDQARAEEGTGLGLNIAKAICVAHGGSLRIESRAGRGTLAVVTFPLY